MPPIPTWSPPSLSDLLSSWKSGSGEAPLTKRATFPNGRLPDRFIPLFIFVGFFIGCLIFIPWLWSRRNRRKEIETQLDDALYRTSFPLYDPSHQWSRASAKKIRELEHSLQQTASTAEAAERVRASQEEKIQLLEEETRLLTGTLGGREQENGILRDLLRRMAGELSLSLRRHGETLKNRASLRRSLIHWQILPKEDESTDSEMDALDEASNLQLPPAKEGDTEEGIAADDLLNEKTYSIYTQINAPASIDTMAEKTVTFTDIDLPITRIVRRNTDPAEPPDRGQDILMDTTTDVPMLRSEIVKLRMHIAALTKPHRIEATVSESPDYRKLEQNYEVALARLDEESLQYITLSTQVRSLKESIVTLQDNIRNKDTRIITMTRRAEELTTINSERQGQLNMSLSAQYTLSHENSGLKLENVEKKRRINALTTENSRRLLEIAEKNDRIEELEVQIASRINDGSEREAKINSLTNDLNTANIRLAFTLKQYYALTLTVTALRSENDSIHTQLEAERPLNITLQSEVDSLKRKNGILSSANAALRSPKPPDKTNTKSTSCLRPPTPPKSPTTPTYKPYRPSNTSDVTLHDEPWSPKSTNSSPLATNNPFAPKSTRTNSNPFTSSSRPHSFIETWRFEAPRHIASESDLGTKPRPPSFLAGPPPTRVNTTASTSVESPWAQLPTVPPPPVPERRRSGGGGRSPLRVSFVAGNTDIW
ncbi:hypothetical protein BJ508DRAFT_415508 [Ascobolus immersus RN42]|uniref:Uncharacterized protein n=1 Tax=Ascobolus immersus RN42 TaxID=1160509 RepID=A0A3N4I7P3_ASCIM|nr:hypothetical protein BJ508DRAFT_415508 [Ascobolus immersus RN42]